MSDTTVQDFVHKFVGHKNDPNLCQFSVSTHDRWIHWHQCSRKITQSVDEVGFCKTHAAEVRRNLGKSESNIIKYDAQFYYGKPIITKIYAESETPKMITVLDSEIKLGSYFYIGSGKQNKSRLNLFDTLPEAVEFLYQESQKRHSDALQSVSKAQSVMHELGEMLRKKGS